MNQDLLDTVLADLVKKRSAGDVPARTVDRYQADPLHCTADSQQKLEQGLTGDEARCGRKPVKGGWVCATHGSKKKEVREAAEKRVVVAEATTLVRMMSMRREITPAEAMQEGLERRAFDMDYLGDMLERAQGDIVLKAAVRPLYRDSITDTVKIGEVAERLELGKKEVEIDRKRMLLAAQQFQAVLVGILEDLGHSLDDQHVLDIVDRRLSQAMSLTTGS